ncbi:hypothetical protein SCHPADRAFT_1001191 [Schizopora paradoxa]|uniref:Uncharacterized protein n=1 Tax=Schizopora paradoxa TaxID=27342 RepID=A0A0H2RT92_9AGAM|nr:hypothetical protein SCHPADRAFT_1001191 [Schizopora paradoxa]
MKSCLKQRDVAATSKRPCCSRTVSFRGQDLDEIHPADDWDRSPVDVNTKLSYDDILELKQMQIEIRRACARSQGNDAGQRPFLNIPIPILPLLPSTSAPPLSKPPSSSPSPSTASSSPTPTLSALSESCSSTSFSASGVACGLCSDCIRRARYSSSSYAMRTPPDTPPRSTLKSIPAPTRARNFLFLPLLEASPPPAPSIPAPPPVPRAQHRWNACLDSDVDQSDDENTNDGWPSDWPGSRRAARRTTTSPSFSTPPQSQSQKTGAGQAELSPATPPSPPAEVDRPGSSYFAPVTFKANTSAKGSSGTSPTRTLTSPSAGSSSRSPTRAVSPKLPPLTKPAFDLYPPNSPPSPPSPTLDGSILDLRKCSLEANTNRPKPKQFKFVPLA